MPVVAKFASPFFARSQASSAATSCAGTAGCTATTKGWLPSSATGAKSPSGSSPASG